MIVCASPNFIFNSRCTFRIHVFYFFCNTVLEKTTLLNHLNGILKLTSGNIYFEDKPLTYDAKSLLNLRKRVGFVFQDPNDQLFASSVKQDVEFGPLNLGYTPEHVKQLVDDALKTVGVTEFADKPPHFLSGV